MTSCERCIKIGWPCSNNIHGAKGFETKWAQAGKAAAAAVGTSRPECGNRMVAGDRNLRHNKTVLLPKGLHPPCESIGTMHHGITTCRQSGSSSVAARALPSDKATSEFEVSDQSDARLENFPVARPCFQ